MPSRMASTTIGGTTLRASVAEIFLMSNLAAGRPGERQDGYIFDAVADVAIVCFLAKAGILRSSCGMEEPAWSAPAARIRTQP